MRGSKRSAVAGAQETNLRPLAGCVHTLMLGRPNGVKLSVRSFCRQHQPATGSYNGGPPHRCMCVCMCVCVCVLRGRARGRGGVITAARP